ncbi:MAG: hypothetical protein EOO61_02955 [Hymenobacter sp.]|nr:MAG: hypothetical protein EOO61_02955 [Hymenobacter sp.]
MYVLKINNLQLGDIILSRSSHRLSALVRRQSNSNYSHAALVVADNSCIESRDDGVHSETLQRLGFEQINDALVLRLKTPVSMTSLDSVMNFARSKVGTDYASREEVVRSFADRDASAQEQNRQYCTRLVAQAYSAAGITLVANADYCTPMDIEQSAELEIIPDCLQLASAEQKQWVQEADKGNTIIAKQANITAHFLKQVQQLTSADLQTLEQVDDYLVSDQTYDKQIADLLTTSGYLKIGDEEKAQNPWYYNIAEFEKMGSEQDRHAFAQVQQWHETVRLNSFTKKAQQYEQLAEALQSVYFRVMSACVWRQCELSHERMAVWNATIDAYLPF